MKTEAEVIHDLREEIHYIAVLNGALIEALASIIAECDGRKSVTEIRRLASDAMKARE